MSFKVLAFDSSTETLSVALGLAGATKDFCFRQTAGGNRASQVILPIIQELMAQAQWRFTDLDAIAFGCGPGAFTGVRVACSVAQGLGFASETPVLPINTLLAVAQTAYMRVGYAQIMAALDARMGEVYTASYDFRQLRAPWAAKAKLVCRHDCVVPSGYIQAGNMGGIACLPEASSMLCLARPLLQMGFAIPAEESRPLYIRNKIAQTMAERLHQKTGA